MAIRTCVWRKRCSAPFEQVRAHNEIFFASVKLSHAQRTFNREIRTIELDAAHNGEQARGVRSKRPQSATDVMMLSLEETRRQNGTHSTQTPGCMVTGQMRVSSPPLSPHSVQ